MKTIIAILLQFAAFMTYAATTKAYLHMVETAGLFCFVTLVTIFFSWPRK